MRSPLCLLCLGILACDAETTDRVVDVEGPRGQTLQAGPWPVDVVTRRSVGQLFASVDGGDFVNVSVYSVSPRWVRGELPAAPVGSRVRYFAQVDDDRSPAAGGYEFVVAAPDPGSVAPPAPTACDLGWRRPAVGVALALDDDSAPQAGVQINVIVDGSIPDGTAGVLTVGPRRYAARGLGGLLVFGAVDVPRGEAEFAVEGTTLGGGRCALAGTFSGP